MFTATTSVRTTTLMAALLFLLCTSAYAHPDASSSDFCPNGQIMNTSHHIIEGFALTETMNKGIVECPVGLETSNRPALDKYVGRSMTNNNPVLYMPTHDIFDGPAKLAYTYASCICASLLNKKINFNAMRPLLTGPDSLVSDNHHNAYQLSEGLSFSCSICVNPREQLSEQ